MGRRDADKPVTPLLHLDYPDSCGRYVHKAPVGGLWAWGSTLVNPHCGAGVHAARADGMLLQASAAAVNLSICGIAAAVDLSPPEIADSDMRLSWT